MNGRSARVAALADAAIALLAEGGMRALTHRAVDARAGVPVGTTSAYLRTRQALIEAVVRRLVDLDRADLMDRELPTAAPAPGPPPRLTPADLDHLAVATAQVLDRWLTTGRDRSLARYACLLEAVHRPELRPILAHGTVLREQARALLADAARRTHGGRATSSSPSSTGCSSTASSRRRAQRAAARQPRRAARTCAPPSAPCSAPSPAPDLSDRPGVRSSAGRDRLAVGRGWWSDGPGGEFGQATGVRVRWSRGLMPRTRRKAVLSANGLP
ncbi:TetR/AcrR family transcriptional regulator [Micromonospora sp. 4G55]|uniref:TetR/AcrR family transcriptional regulator n=1 Tax=Micromonospora sp. 4G55 TaxID=2806102 RepID=UPI001EE417AD|nr:TetR family transcriptional regulator [Micromonospora sp. 4G55]